MPPPSFEIDEMIVPLTIGGPKGARGACHWTSLVRGHVGRHRLEGVGEAG